MEVGQQVTYRAPGKIEQGIMKSISDDKHVFVVYHCDGNWIDTLNIQQPEPENVT